MGELVHKKLVREKDVSGRVINACSVVNGTCCLDKEMCE